ncbi:MAG TPA: transglycosylase domain-containing protein, partial [Candidatus Paceibacterota bacterium]
MSLKGFYKRHRHTIKKWVTFFFALGIFLAGVLILWAANLKIPDFKSFDERQIVQSTKVYDRTGTVLLYNSGENVRRSNVTSTEISRNVKNATVAIEDREFYNHIGIRPTSIVRAFLSNIFTGGNTQGGSTITQQIIKNVLLTGEKSIARKLKEAVLAIKLERVMSKDDILTLYLNEAPYGGNIYGIEEASQAFFGKPAADLSLAESAYLAALPQSPTRFSPYGQHKDLLEARKNLVLSRMQELGFATTTEVEAAKKEAVAFLPQNNFAIKAPHFVFFVLSYLEDKYGREVAARGGLKVITTLDWDMQKKTEEVVGEFAPINEKNYNAKNMGVVAEDPHNGQILVMVGSRDYYETENDGNFNVTLAHRQPGSSFKPFVYATAFKKGYTPDTVLFDLPTQFQTTCSPIVTAVADKGNAGDCYAPSNYDVKFRGPMTLRSALAQSINVPSIEVLYLAGIRDSLVTAADLGISSLGNANQYGLTLVLGGGEVSPLEMTGAYATFASDGVYHPY